MNISDYLRTALLNHSLGVTPYVSPTHVYAALYTTAPTGAGGGIEVSAADYARVSTTWSPASLGSIQNSLDIRFPNNGVTLSDWGTVNTLGLFDTITNGNLLWFGPLSAQIHLALGTSFAFAPTYLTLTLI